MNVLKSLVDWEKSRRESEKKSKTSQSNEEEGSSGESVDIKSWEDFPSNFEKAKAHKSTIEAAISEVIYHVLLLSLFLLSLLFVRIVGTYLSLIYVAVQQEANKGCRVSDIK